MPYNLIKWDVSCLCFSEIKDFKVEFSMEIREIILEKHFDRATDKKNGKYILLDICYKIYNQ